jgi:hypothetical protein
MTLSKVKDRVERKTCLEEEQGTSTSKGAYADMTYNATRMNRVTYIHMRLHLLAESNQAVTGRLMFSTIPAGRHLPS